MKKRILAIPLTLLLALSLAAAGCPPPVVLPPIKIGVIGPMEFIQGEHHWYGAILAADEINEAGGIWVEGVRREIELVRIDSNELLCIWDARAAMERAITVYQVDFVIGGYEIRASLLMQGVAMDHRVIYLGAGVAVSEMVRMVGRDYERYKYFFRISPNSYNMARANLLLLEMVGDTIRKELGIERPAVAIVAEDAIWVDDFWVIPFMLHHIPAELDMEVVGVWRPSPTAIDVSFELTSIEEAGAQIILFFGKGPVGITLSKQWNELQIPTALLGINLEAMMRGFWEATEGKGEYVMTWHSIGRVEMTPKTIPFIDKFVERFGEYPFKTAVTYDAIFVLKEAIERAGSIDPDYIVAELKKTDHLGAFGRIRFTPRGFYQLDHEVPHCLRWGPEYVTQLGLQWRDGARRVVWPWDWYGVTHPGTVRYQLPPWVIEHWRG